MLLKGASPILVVDPDVDARGVLVDALRCRGYVVSEAGGGREALDLLIGNRDDEPRMIVLELDLPGMSGPELLAITKSYLRLARIPVVAIGHAPRAELLREGTVIGYLRRPVDADALSELIEQHSIGRGG